MTDSIKLPISFWIIAAAALIWNVMGAGNFMYQMNAENVASLPESHQILIEGRPIWATVGFAVCVFGGAIGAVALILRRFWAVPLFAFSFIGTVVAIVAIIGKISEAQLTGGEVAIMVIMPVFVGLIMWLYARKCFARGWLR